jgi:glyoxylase-like metal-dependent hydrolase (beta-lactamase superfamily II)
VVAVLTVLAVGYADERVASTVVLLRDGDTVTVVDPGMVASREMILDPLRDLGIAPEAVTDVILSHHHPDHTMNVALFPAASVHDVQATYTGDVWDSRPAEGRHVSTDVWLLETPGHTPQDVTTVVRTETGLVVCTHLWWRSDGPLEDPYAPDAAVLASSRRRVLALEPVLVVPGHGGPFAPDATTPV